jgi:hypothetical protein
VGVESGWDAISDSEIEELHDSVNSLFFTQILTRELIDRLEPEYEKE